MIAEAVTGPTPGMVINRLAVSSALTDAASSLSIAPMALASFIQRVDLADKRTKCAAHAIGDNDLAILVGNRRQPCASGHRHGARACGAMRPISARWPRKALSAAVRWPASSSRARWRICSARLGLATPADAEVVRFVGGLVTSQDLSKVDFGTEGGLFWKRLGVPVVVCGPGSMDQGHKPDEFIALDQLEACDRMMEQLLQRCL